LCAATLQAADADPTEASRNVQLPDPPVHDLNRIGLSYRVGYNISAKFTGLGGFAAQSNPGPSTGGVNHEYDDGYVRVDSTHNGLGLTWNWGFDSASQVQGDNLLLSSTRTVASGSAREGANDFQHGIEATYARELGTFRKARWGFEGAFNFMNVNMRNNASVPVSVTRLTDTYALDGVIPFDPITSQNPYQGTFMGPGPLIADAPIQRTEQVVPSGAIATGSRRLDANLFGLRIGPYIELPLSPKWTVGLNGGLALVMVESNFRFNETVSYSNTSLIQSGSKSDTDLLPGGYIEGNIAYQLNKSVSLQAGVQFQDVGDFTQKVNGKKATLHLTSGLLFTLGANYSF